MDVILRGGTVVDGTGEMARKADVGLRAGRIEEVGDLSAAEAPLVVDVTGRVVAPGFIDVHAHHDWAPFLPAEHDDVRLANVRQGVTTDVCGNCGTSPFPVLDGLADELASSLGPAFRGFFRTFPSLARYRAELESTPMATNVAPLVGHGTVRGSVMGQADRAPTPDELDRMRRLVAQAMEEGAFGMSTGLIYAPGRYARTEEIIELARAVQGFGGRYTTHMRNEGAQVVEAVEEALRIGRESGAAVEISHHKVGGEANWGKSQQTLALIGAAREGGMDVGTDAYPYTAASTGLNAYLPGWVNAQSNDERRRTLGDAESRRRIEQDLGEVMHARSGTQGRDIWELVVIASCGEHDEYAGRSIAEIARERGANAADTICDLLLHDMATIIISHAMNQDEVRSIGTQPFTVVGSDGAPLPGRQHPRTAGAFTRVLGELFRGERDGSLEDTVHRMSGASAERFGLHGRGTIARGRVADLVVFDAATVTDGATFEDPYLPPVGVDHVLIDGAFVIRDGADTGARVGRLLAPA